MTSGRTRGRCSRASVSRAALACLALATSAAGGHAQTLTSDLFRPVRDGFSSPQDSPLRKTDGTVVDTASDDRKKDKPAPSRIGQIPTYGLPAAAGAAGSGYDSLNRTRKKPKLYPGQPKPKRPLGPGSPIPIVQNPLLPPPKAPQPLSATANKTPLPPAMLGTVVGQPIRKRLKVDDDPFGPVGDYAGSFLVKSAVELSGGYDTNPGRSPTPRGSSFYVVAPELVVFSDWERHALVADLRGSYTGYGNNFPQSGDSSFVSVPTSLDRPDFTGHVDGRIDVSRDTKLLGQARLRVSTDNPGSPNLVFGLSRYPINTTVGTTLGVDQTFNRLQISAGATVDRTAYQDSRLTDGSSSSNADRNFNQYGGIARVSYDLFPGLKPFAEVEGDTRVRDQSIDRFGFQRDSVGGYAKAGTSFELTRLITGEVSVGYTSRSYTDPRLDKLTGLLTSASLVWAATPLTTVKFNSNTSVDETTLGGVSGVLTRTYTAEVNHDFRRWLTAVGRFTYGTQDYQGVDATRFDQIYSVSGDLIYKLNRNLWIKGQVRHDILNSNISGVSSSATVFMLGMRAMN